MYIAESGEFLVFFFCYTYLYISSMSLEVTLYFLLVLFRHPVYFFISKSIKSSQNKGTMAKLIKEIKGLNPSFDAAEIRGM